MRKGWRGRKTEVADDDGDDDKRSEITKNRMIKWESDDEGKKTKLRNAEVKENNIKKLKISRENYVKLRYYKQNHSSCFLRLVLESLNV